MSVDEKYIGRFYVDNLSKQFRATDPSPPPGRSLTEFVLRSELPASVNIIYSDSGHYVPGRFNLYLDHDDKVVSFGWHRTPYVQNRRPMSVAKTPAQS